MALHKLGVAVMMAVLSGAGVTGAAAAAQKTVVLPFDLVLQKKEEDFYIGPSKPTPAEAARLSAVHQELTQLLAADGAHEIVDPSAIAKDIEAAAPLVDCNGCEVDLAKKIGGELVFTGMIDKASETLLNMQIAIVDVASGKLKRSASVVIQGNTDESWLRGVRWLYKNRLTSEQTP